MPWSGPGEAEGVAPQPECGLRDPAGSQVADSCADPTPLATAPAGAWSPVIRSPGGPSAPGEGLRTMRAQLQLSPPTASSSSTSCPLARSSSWPVPGLSPGAHTE